MILSCCAANAQTAKAPAAVVAGIPANYDEALVGTYKLPDPLTLANGKQVRDAKTWFEKRRPEIVRLFEEDQYGRSPLRPAGMSFDVFDKGTPALDGKAVRRQVTVYFSEDKSGPKMDLLLYLPANARKPAPLLLNLSFADSAIAFYDAKYTYRLWRPVTAIRLADSDGNPLTVADPTWLPLSVNTAADPSYPGAHSTISAAGADVLASFYGDHQSFSVTSTALPGVTRSFRSFAAAAQEAGLSRIFSGQHTRLDHVAGVKLGREVAGFVLHNALLPAHDSSGK